MALGQLRSNTRVKAKACRLLLEESKGPLADDRPRRRRRKTAHLPQAAQFSIPARRRTARAAGDACLDTWGQALLTLLARVIAGFDSVAHWLATEWQEALHWRMQHNVILPRLAGLAWFAANPAINRA